ncbi:MAG: hypothetical protein KAI66_15475, partial [Lentisphaeria bacterium]|nr:hypothetical protein [Lentisphaeria bacterium]
MAHFPRLVRFLAVLVIAGVARMRAADEAPRQFDPRTLFPSEEVVTPHVSWFKPAEGGALQVLFIITQSRMREVVELAQRMDMDYSVFAVPDSPGGFNMPPLT